MLAVSRFAHNDRVEQPETVPIRHAATVMIVDERPDLQVLMVQRTSRAVFAASAWVFPGGRVDPEDVTHLDRITTGLDRGSASSILDTEADGRAWWFAGLRETVEETGLLLGAGDASSETVDAIRQAVHADAAMFAGTLLEHDVTLDLSAMHEVGRFITPPGPPRRFDARFFVAAAPANQIASHDEEEIVRHEWISPANAIERWREDDFPMMSVTHRMLACLARYDSVDELMALASSQPESHRVRVLDPDGEYHVVLPGDPGYDDADLEIEHGWVRI